MVVKGVTTVLLLLLLRSTSAHARFCRSGLQRQDAVRVRAECSDDGIVFSWESDGWPFVDTFQVEYTCTSLTTQEQGRKTILLEYYILDAGSIVVPWSMLGSTAVECTFMGCYENDYFEPFAIPSIMTTCGEIDTEIPTTSIVASPTPTLTSSLLNENVTPTGLVNHQPTMEPTTVSLDKEIGISAEIPTTSIVASPTPNLTSSLLSENATPTGLVNHQPTPESTVSLDKEFGITHPIVERGIDVGPELLARPKRRIMSSLQAKEPTDHSITGFLAATIAAAGIVIAVGVLCTLLLVKRARHLE